MVIFRRGSRGVCEELKGKGWHLCKRPVRSRNQFLVEKRTLNSGMTSLGKVRSTQVNVFQPPFHFTVFFSTYTRSRRSIEFFMLCVVQAILNYKNIAESLVTNVFFGAAVREPFSLAKPLDIFQRFGNNVTKRNNGLRWRKCGGTKASAFSHYKPCNDFPTFLLFFAWRSRRRTACPSKISP